MRRVAENKSTDGYTLKTQSRAVTQQPNDLTVMTPAIITEASTTKSSSARTVANANSGGKAIIRKICPKPTYDARASPACGGVMYALECILSDLSFSARDGQSALALETGPCSEFVPPGCQPSCAKTSCDLVTRPEAETGTRVRKVREWPSHVGQVLESTRSTGDRECISGTSGYFLESTRLRPTCTSGGTMTGTSIPHGRLLHRQAAARKSSDDFQPDRAFCTKPLQSSVIGICNANSCPSCPIFPHVFFKICTILSSSCLALNSSN